MIPAQDRYSKDVWHWHDDSEQDIQLDHEDDILPSIDGSPNGQRQQGLTPQGTFRVVLERLRFERLTPTPRHSKWGTYMMFAGITTPMSGGLQQRLGKNYQV